MRINRNYARLLFLAILILFLLSLTACVKKPPIILRGGSSVVEVKVGQPAPTDGYLLSPEALVEIMECCGDKLQ